MTSRHIPTPAPTPTPSIRRRRPLGTARRGALVAAALGLAVTACGDDEPAADAASVATQPPVATEPAASADATVEVVLDDYGFVGLPQQIQAGTRLTVTNVAEAELHELVAFRLADTETRSVHELMTLPPEELEALFTAAPPAAVLLAAPGGEQIAAVGDGTLSEPGRYLITCNIPTGVDPQEYLAGAAASNGQKPDVPGGPPHFVHGMFGEIEVVA